MRLALDESLAKSDAEAVRTIKRLERELSDELSGCLALVAVDPSLDVDDALDAGVEFAGLLGRPEREISREEAASLLAAVIERDLAYRAPRLGAAPAGSAAAEFLGIFSGPDALFFTNGELGLTHSLGKTGAWAPLTRATFDTGVVAIEGKKLGVFWIEDED
jgi:hypothetical protein